MDYEITYRDIIEARERGLDALNEASLGRAYQHMQKQGEHSFGIVTAHRSDATPEQNRKNMKALKGELRGLGHGHIRMKGHWEGQSEPSLFVPGLSRHHAERLGRKYNQDAVIHSGPESNHEVHLIQKSGETANLGTFHPGKIAQAYSSIKGKPFTFEWLTNSTAEALIERIYGIQSRV